MGGNRNGKNFVIQARSDGKRDFFQHDDRNTGNTSNTSPRNNQNFRYKSQGKGESSQKGFAYQYKDNFSNNRRRFQGNRRGGGPRGFPQDGDVQMRDDKTKHQRFYEQMRGSRKGHKPRQTYFSNSGWSKIMIKQASSYPKEEVIEAIKGLVTDDFDPVLMENEGPHLVFYLERNFNVAKAIVNLSGRLSLGNNHKIYINVTDTTPPARKLTPPQKEILKMVLSDRYGVEMKRLDLTNFHNDKTLLREYIFVPLYRRMMALSVIEVLVINCLQVEEIDFSNNNLSTMNDFAELKNFPNLKRLYLQKNKLRQIESLQKLKGLPVIEVLLDGNTLCDRFKDGDTYVSAVREVFPKVERLDGMELPKPIGFEVDDDVNLPPIRTSFFFSEEVKNVVLKFLQQYFQVFESDDRKPLEAAYTEDALFSLSANFPENGFGARLTTWADKENRNLKRVTNVEKRQSLLYKGRAAVGYLLNRLPNVQHDPNSFVIDIPIAKPCLVHVVLTGVFKQLADKNPPHRSFMKSMVIVPVGGGFCISNEELYINNATVEQAQKAFSVVTPAVSASSTESVTPQGFTQPPTAELDTTKLELIKQFAANSKMLPEYSKLCLERNDWDFNKAGQMFLNMQKENKIPPEYFGLPPT